MHAGTPFYVKNTKGFSLVETLVSAGIVIFATLVALSFLNSGQMISQKTRKEVEAASDLSLLKQALSIHVPKLFYTLST